MGNKTSSRAYRVGITLPWENSSYIDDDKFLKLYHVVERAINNLKKHNKNFETYIYDFKICVTQTNNLKIEIFSRYYNRIKNNVSLLDQIKKKIDLYFSRYKLPKYSLNIFLEKPRTNSAAFIADSIKEEILNRKKYKPVIKKHILDALNKGAQGIQIWISGRLNGSEIARREKFFEGKIPLSTIRYTIDQFNLQIKTKMYGVLGLKVWVNNGLYGGEKLYK